ncbi:MAG: hypothetical protein FWF71_04840 [Actinomycetia bacterium]|nr:hypothetical protein [Actinomycetes bacterium]
MNRKFVAEGGVEVTDELLDEWAEPWERGETSPQYIRNKMISDLLTP